ncbi:hypothetical protein [Fodinibius sp. Rm-B-1B1-1]|uniref:hypothetical protein n=1 Tax=Fodinibius alkaliphilus TaxID=3140241 RepID=UPI00315A3137
MAFLGINITLTSFGLILDILGASLLFWGNLSWKKEGDKAVLKKGITWDEGLSKPIRNLRYEQFGLGILILGFILQFIASISN